MTNEQLLQYIINQELGLFELLLLNFDWSEKIPDYKNILSQFRQQRILNPNDTNLEQQILRLSKLIKILEFIIDLKDDYKIKLN